ncbi:MAG: 2-succinyl-5-enolpyruvyl-6-hydroxy-3-cyclohexene-1-carboxylic-acid synthase [Acidimicrobiales bacterium]
MSTTGPSSGSAGGGATGPTTAATFCATLVDEFARAGVVNAFAAPGSRSTPLALALHADRRIRLQIFHDERPAAFAALGHAMATGLPSIVVCTSGTAAAHLHPAVIEADLSAVPLIVCTTDRPPELWDVGAPQTVDQTGLYGHSVRFYLEPGVPTEQMRHSWRSMASRLVAEANGGTGPPGPVQVNLSFRDPLVGRPGPLPEGRSQQQPWHGDLRSTNRSGANEAEIPEVWNRLRGLDGVLVAGHGTSDPASVLALGRALGWPVLADHRSGCRAEGQAIAHFDSLLRSAAFTDRSEPDVVIRFGQPLASKALSQLLGDLNADTISALARSRWIDPERIASTVVSEAGLARGLLARVPSDYRPSAEAERWERADSAAEKAIVEGLASIEAVTEPGVARTVVELMPAGGSLLVASSMPVRDVEWFAPNRRRIRVYANRGANGIDGLISTAIGIALSGSPTTLLIGDVAFLHDSSALIALRDRAVALTIVVIDNDGGGIFSFLPQAEQLGSESFERLFGTPHGTDIATLCRAHGIEVSHWPPDSLEPGRPKVVIATTDRPRNVAVHELLNRAVAEAIDGLGAG